MKTFSAKAVNVTRKWYILDASETSLGRLSTVAAALLIGKRKPQFTTHVDCGDYIIVINAKDLIVTGNKRESKMYYSHSGYPGALKERSLADQLTRDPTVVIFHAIRGMLPVNKLRDDRLNRLKIYVDGEHKHEAQKPEAISVKGQK